jgi:hypothetical protein
MGSGYLLRTDLEDFSYFTDLRLIRGEKKIPIRVSENKTQNQRNHVYFAFVKYLVVSFPSHSNRSFSVFLGYSLRIISGT